MPITKREVNRPFAYYWALDLAHRAGLASCFLFHPFSPAVSFVEAPALMPQDIPDFRRPIIVELVCSRHHIGIQAEQVVTVHSAQP